MTSNRRHFIRLIVAGSLTAGCPVDLSLVAASRPSQASEGPGGAPPTASEADGEHNEICHQVRDGHRFGRPPVSKRYDIVIAGGGVSGLAAAYLVRQRDFLLLEKEPHWGGNAYLEEYDGQAFATGSAFIDGSETPAVELAKEVGLELLPVNSPDGTIIHGEHIPDTWRAGLDRLPYPSAVRESFKKFRRDRLDIPVQGRERELDNEPFSKYFEGYAPEVKQWWDNYGPSNWGARTEESAALRGISEFQYLASEKHDDSRFTWPGGLGAITQRLAELLTPEHGDRMLARATLVAAEQDKHEVRVTYVHEGDLKTAAAKTVIMATPKFITRRIVSGIPGPQQEAMKKIRYIPYPVVNLIFARPVFNRGYDTWCPGNTFTDFVVADWTVRNRPGYRQKNNILTFYTPLREAERAVLLTEDGSRDLAARVLADFQKLFPGSNVDPVEVHIYRRGHPLYMSTPGNFTQVQPLARRPMERIFFANTDSEGPESTTSKAIAAARRAVREMEAKLASA